MVEIAKPSPKEVEKYLKRWDGLDNYVFQEQALDRLFFKMCPKNNDIHDVLLKSSVLNDFYGTNIFSIFPVAQHILEMDIDKKLEAGDSTLVNEITAVKTGGKVKHFYSFATKYCSHHQPLKFAIYDYYVERCLMYFKRQDKFAKFKLVDLTDYPKFMEVLHQFRDFYGLSSYNLKQIDQYLWQLGKEYFPRKYSK